MAQALGRGVSLDAALRYVVALPNAHVPSYAEADVSPTWNVTRRVQLQLDGRNLLHARHLEFTPPQSTEVPRVGEARVRWRF